MAKRKNKRTPRRIHRHRHKHGLSSPKTTRMLLNKSALRRQVDNSRAETRITAHQTQQITEATSDRTAMSPVGNFTERSAMPSADQPARFKKFKDDRSRNSPKRLQPNAQKKKKKMDRKYIQKLMSSIKKKYRMNKGPHFKRRLEFRNDPPAEAVLPKPKFYRPPKANGSSTPNQNDTIEDGEIVEGLEISDDDDDCVLLEPPTAFINIDDDESDGEPSTSDRSFKAFKRRAELLAPSPQILFKDCHRQTALLRTSKPTNQLLYSTMAKKTVSEASYIVSDDSFETARPKTSQTHADSVIVIDDTITEEDFIPLPPDDPILKSSKTKGKKWSSKRMNDSLFTSAEKKELCKYNRNTFNPSEESEETDNEPKSNKRAVIIDGSNVAFAHGNSNIFSSEGIKYCLQYFDKMGHNAKAVIPAFRKNATKSSNPELLDKLHKEGKIVFTPCKNLPGKMSTSYDDRFILQLAYEWNAAVVSNDNYRDLINENPAFKKIVETRVLGYSWCDNIFILPKDPYGRWGPTLDEILKC
ncbi:probable ribonuclease ZC3H12C isoform X1 [Drosophila miranda]|uniref:probable ribonuclease ZC3H12C isoform X1 n=1 Tax=Drosophila miranda TaxID=7229 RepID=UPI0007E83ECD|nr:probable ribonuclease ZC3H12C isoform X1 [Drosophila miranda]